MSKLTKELEDRWKNLNTLLTETHSQVFLEMEAKKFYDELDALEELMSNYEKWAITAEHISDEALEISKQLEQCRVSLPLPLFIHKSLKKELFLQRWECY